MQSNQDLGNIDKESLPVPVGSLVEIRTGISKGSRLFIVHIVREDNGNISYGMTHNLNNIIEIKALQRELRSLDEYRRVNTSKHSQINHDFAEKLTKESLSVYKKNIDYKFKHEDISLVSLPEGEIEVVFKDFILN